MVPAGRAKFRIYNGQRSRTKARNDCPSCKRSDHDYRRYLSRKGWVCEACFAEKMQRLTISARDVRPGDIAFGMVVIDVDVEGGRAKFVGVSLIAESTRTDLRKSTIGDSEELVVIDRPRFSYRPRRL